MKTLAEHRKLLCPFRFDRPNPQCLGDACAGLIFEEPPVLTYRIPQYSTQEMQDRENEKVAVYFQTRGYSNVTETSDDNDSQYIFTGTRDPEGCKVTCGPMIPRLVAE